MRHKSKGKNRSDAVCGSVRQNTYTHTLYTDIIAWIGLVAKISYSETAQTLLAFGKADSLDLVLLALRATKQN